MLVLFCARAAADGDVRTYEDGRLDAAVAAAGFQVEPHAEGRRIAFVRLVRDDVFIDGEPYPTLLNVLHWRTTEGFAKRELLFSIGDVYLQEVIEETERNLRERGYFAFVRIVPVKTRDPAEVGVLVHTRDRWSLRLEPEWETTGGDVNYLQLDLTERNLFGRANQAVARYRLTPFTHDIGQTYLDRRVFGEELSLSEAFEARFNREHGGVEATKGELGLGRPFYTLDDRWSYDARVEYFDGVSRNVKGSGLATVQDENGDDTGLRPVYDDRWASVLARVSRRRGAHHKQIFTFGAGFKDRAVVPNAETMLEPGREAEFARRVLPVTRREAFPLARYDVFLPRYEAFQNLTTYGVTETVRKGPDAGALFTLPLRAFGSSSDAFVAQGWTGYVWAEDQALLDVHVQGTARLDDGAVVDQRLLAFLRGATPPLGVGRLVLSARWDARRRDTNKTPVSLGGDSGLRGHASGAISEIGGNLALANLELRTLPLDLDSVQLGAVAFYDVGTVYLHLAEADLRHDVGLGLRVVFPQIEPLVFRFDFGVPLDGQGFAVVVGTGLGQPVKLVGDDWDGRVERPPVRFRR